MNASKIILVMGIILLAIFLFYLSSSFYQLIALSIIISYFIHPLKKKFLLKVKNENLASVLALISGILIVSAIILILLLSLYNSVSGVKSILTKNPDIQLAFLSITLFRNININELLTTTGINQLFNVIQLIFLLIPNILITTLIFSLFLFYFIKYGEEIFDIIKGLVPPGEIRVFDAFIEKVNLVMKSIFQAQFFTAFIESALVFIALIILGIPHAFELSLFTFIMGFLSITTIIVPLGVNVYYFYLSTISGDFSIFIATVIFSLFIFMLDDFVKPLICKKIAKTNMLLFLLGALGGMYTLGITGFIIGPLITSSAKILFEMLYPKKFTASKD